MGSENQKSSLNLTNVKSQSNEQPDSANQGSATNELRVSGAKAADPNTLTESKAATTDDSLATGLSYADFHKQTRPNYNNKVISRNLTLNKPSGVETIKQTVTIRTITLFNNVNNDGRLGARIAEVINNNGKSSNVWVFAKEIHYTITDGKVFFNTAADKQNYDDFMKYGDSAAFQAALPAIDESQLNVPGYSYTISPANSNLSEWTFQPLQTNSVNIEVNYNKNATHTVTYKFVDQNGQEVGTATPVSGPTGSAQTVKLTVPTGYQLASGNLPTTVTIPNNDQTVTINVKKNQQKVSIQVTGNSSMYYGDSNWQQLLKNKSVPTGFNVTVTAADGTTEPVQLTDGDLEVQGTPGNVGSYTVVLTAQGLQDIKDQLGTDDFTYPDLTAVTSSATLDIQKANKEVILHGSGYKPYDGTNDLSSFQTQFALGDNNANKVTVFKSDGTPVTIALQKDDVVLKNGENPINVGSYDVKLSDNFINKVKAADGNNGNNYNWKFDSTASYQIYADDGVAKLSGQNAKVYNGQATTTAEVNKDGKITVHVTAPVTIQGDEPGESTTVKTLDYGNYTLQDGDYTWNTTDGKAPTDGGAYIITLNKDAIVAHLQDYLKQKAGVGQDNQPNVTINADGLSGQASFTINTTNTYKFVDTDNKNQPISSDVKTGLNGQSEDISLQIPENYEPVSGALPTKATFGPTNQTITISLKHEHSTTTTPVTVTRVVTITEPGQKPKVQNQTVTFQKTTDTDLVTKHQTETYDHDTQKLTSVTVPTVPGYTASQTSVPELTVKPTDHPAAVNITYTPNEQTGNIIYVDQDNNGQQVGTTPLTGKTDDTVTITPQAPTGYQIVAGQSTPKTEKATANGIPNVTVKVEHKTVIVQPTDPKTPSDKLPDNPGKNYPSGVAKDNLNKTIKRTIIVKKPNGNTIDASQTVHLTRTATVDEVTGKVTHYGDWTTSSFDKYTTPTIPGYTPTQAEVPSVATVDVNYVDPKIEISYTPNEQTGNIVYVDQNNNGQQVGTTPLTGKTDETITITPNIPAGYKLVPGQNIPKTEKATPNGIPTVTVQVEHQTTTVQPTDPKTPSDKLPDNPGKNYPTGVDYNDLHKTIKRTITVIKPDGSKIDASQTIILTRTAKIDEVTGTVIGYSDWTTGHLTAYDAPKIPGYVASLAEVPAIDVTSDFSDPDIVITYTALPASSTGHGINHGAITNGKLNNQLPTQSKANDQAEAKHQAELPQTGNTNAEQLATLGLLSAGLTSLFGLASLRKKKHN
ncbi:MAG TPA: MucBP domain-containing protein [Limosilactobacillus coleohominis]|nr:MucBP domain-containing protein [Limosilactobacillus coleohominis]